MKYIKNIGISTLYIIASLLIFTFIMTFFSYFNIIGDKWFNIYNFFNYF